MSGNFAPIPLAEADCANWEFTKPQKKDGAMLTTSYINRQNGVFGCDTYQLPGRYRVKHPVTPGLNKSCEDYPHDRRSIELDMPHSCVLEHTKFGEFDAVGLQQTFQNQQTYWPRKKPKAIDELVSEGLYRPSIFEPEEAVLNRWGPSCRVKGVPPGVHANTPDNKLSKEELRRKKRDAKNETHVFVMAPDEKSVRRGTLDDVRKDCMVSLSIRPEALNASKDLANLAYPVCDIVVYTPEPRPETMTLNLPGVTLDEDKPSATKRARIEEPAQAGSGDGGGGGDGDGGEQNAVDVASAISDAAQASQGTNVEVKDEEGDDDTDDLEDDGDVADVVAAIQDDF